MSTNFKAPKKLIEVALPLPEMNDASAYDKMPGIGPHPKGIHQWWARLPLPTARAVLFASVVDDPEEHPEKWPTEEAQSKERERLFGIIRGMMAKKLHDAPEIYSEAHSEMLKHCDGVLPLLFDPFSGGGSIPLEGNRLGFDVTAADLNPVAVLLNLCNLELAPAWVDRPPINPRNSAQIGGRESWRGTDGLAADLRYYARNIHANARAEAAGMYPTVPLRRAGGAHQEANVIAWLWARTVASPSPAARGEHVPLVSTYWLSTKKDGLAWLEPVVDKAANEYSFRVCSGIPKNRTEISAGTKLGRGAKFRCLLTDDPISEAYLKEEAKAGRLRTRLVAVVVDGGRTRCYLPASPNDEAAARTVEPSDFPSESLVYDSRYLTPPGYGMTSIDKLFTPRQLRTLVALSDYVRNIGDDVLKDAERAGLSTDEAESYARTVITFLALAVDRCSDFNNALCRWSASNQKVMNLFGRQAIPMVWDFAEANLLGDSVGSWTTCSEYVADCVEVLTMQSGRSGRAIQVDAAGGTDGLRNLLISTDPPYYDNVPYADISDFFYVWLRRTVGRLYPELFATLMTPKMPELTASPQRFSGDKEMAKNHFESGFRRTFTSLKEAIDPRFPLTVYYAFKQDDEEGGSSDADAEGAASAIDLTTGWETLLEALISSGFQITATWPIRASQSWRMRAMGSNALASYIVLACRPRSAEAMQNDRRAFVSELKRELPLALKHLQQGNVAPVDFAQAAIGPGMAIYSRYSRILESNGNAMSVRTALTLINQTLTEVLSELEDEFDSETRWAIPWFEQHGFGDGDFGDAELLSKAKVTSVSSLQQLHIIHSKGGKVRLLRPDELPSNWKPAGQMGGNQCGK